jgi:hypothetical protein
VPGVGGLGAIRRRIEGAQDYIDAGKPEGDISGIETNDQSGKITIQLSEPDGSFSHVLAMWFAALVPSDTPFRNLTEEPPPGVGPYTITESVPNRQKLARTYGADEIVDFSKEDVVERVMELTGGEGVDTAIEALPYGLTLR